MRIIGKRKKDSDVIACPKCGVYSSGGDYFVKFTVEDNGCPDCVFEGINWAVKKMREEKK